MKPKVAVLGSAAGALSDELQAAAALGRALAAFDVVVLTGATTGLPYLVGKTAHEAGAWHVGISPAGDAEEHATRYNYPLDGCDCLIYTGFGLKGRNVVLVRSCDIALFIAGSMGSLNEFTIACDEGRVIGCLKGTGGVADEAARLLKTFPKPGRARVFYNRDPARLAQQCLAEFFLRKDSV
jgi:hypothetical protein